MKISRLLSLALTLTGGAAATRVLQRRHSWEQSHNRVAICVDYDDAQAAAIRAGLPFSDLLAQLANNGATHLSLPELTLNRLLRLGELTPQAPTQPLHTLPCVGHWNYLYGRADLVAALAAELATRLPYIEAQLVGETTLAFGGNLPVIGEIGLGFDSQAAADISRHGLGVIPRPVSYDWPEKGLLERTLAQAAVHGSLVAFDGAMILGHEMHLDETVEAMSAQGLSFVYFAETRHQKGDWFIAKRRAPHVVLAHALTPQAMIPLDYHAAVHNWVNLARERGIRLCYLNFFRVLHATAPLEGLHYIHHLKHALEDAGFVVAADESNEFRPNLTSSLPEQIPTPASADLALVGLASAGVAAGAAMNWLTTDDRSIAGRQLPEAAATALTLLAAGGAAALPFVEQAYKQRAARHRQLHHHHDHGHHHDGPDHEQHHHDHDHEHHHHDANHDHVHPDLSALYPPSYAPKLLALAAAALAPLAATAPQRSRVNDQWSMVNAVLYPAAASAVLAATTSGPEYQLRIETYRGFNLEWFLPLAAGVTNLPNRNAQAAALVALAAAWLAARQYDIDPLAQVDPAHAEGHTHHISAAMRLVGDVFIALGPQPARKWAGLGPLANGVSVALAARGKRQGAAVATIASTVGYVLGLTGFRRSERALAVTLKEALPSFTAGAALGLLPSFWSPGER